ncbi:MAG TPA: hypothetical protein IAB47_01090 [Candidatus Scatomorpha merdigallinarum]|nr:hypothetical protein [Candidatus Scatomorpha merdigallinarum]
MSDEKNVFDFHGLSDDEELERLLESVRRDIGEASPEPSRRERTPERGEISGERSARPEPPGERPERTPERAATPASRQSQLNQPRPSSHRAAQSRTAVEEREAPRRRPEVQRDLPPERERIRVVHPEDEQPVKKSRFGLAFGIFTAVLAVLIIAACTVLWFYLDAYESTRPEQAMQEFAQLADEEYWSSAVEGAFTVGETPFEDREELMEELCMSVIRENPLEWREDEGYSADNMVYMVSAGGKDICRVTLDEMTENGDAGFGFTYLQVTRVELLASFTAPEAHEITITVPAGATVSVNGVELTDDYIDAEMAIDNAALPDLEANIADRLYTVYTVTGLYAPVEVSAVDADGESIAVEGEATDESVTFALGEGQLDYRILVPEGSTISVNGVELDESYKTGDTVVPAFLEGFSDYGTLPELELWLVEGLHTQPEITVTNAEGSSLDEPVINGTELAFMTGADQTLADSHSGEARDFMSAYAGYISGEAGSDEDYTALQALVLDGSALDTALAELNADYAGTGVSVERVYVRSDSFVSIGATCFICTVDVEYGPAEEGGENSETAYTVVFVMNGGIWLAAEVVS